MQKTFQASFFLKQLIIYEWQSNFSYNIASVSNI